MNISSVRGIYFSPTGTSKSVVQAITDGFEGVSGREETDLTYPEFTAGGTIGENDLTVIGVPVYAGRVPALAAERLKNIQGNGAPVVIVVVYGNREFEDALVELRDIATANGFHVVAAGAFIGEHSFSTAELPIAEGRPDSEDIRKAREFGRSVMEALAASDKSGAKELKIPGNIPYQEGMKNLPFTPSVNHDACTLCETCVANCPTGAVSMNDTVVMDVTACILCCSCIKTCPEGAVSLQAPPIREKMVMLNSKCQARKEPQLYL